MRAQYVSGYVMSANWAEKTRVGHFVAKPDSSSPLICILTIRMEAAGCRPPLERVESVFSSDEACDIFPDRLRYPDRRLWLRWRLGATQGRQALYYPTLPASLQGGHFPLLQNVQELSLLGNIQMKGLA